MPKSIVEHAARYLYSSPPRTPAGAEAIDALQAYRAAEDAAEHAASEQLGLRGLDLLAVRYLLQARRENRLFTQTDLAVMLNLSSAGITKLVARLTTEEWVVRSPHPTDRRANYVTATYAAEERTRAAYSSVHQPYVDTLDAIDPATVHAYAEVVGLLAAAVRRGTSED